MRKIIKIQIGKYEVYDTNNPNERKIINLDILKDTIIQKENELIQLEIDIKYLKKLVEEIEKI